MFTFLKKILPDKAKPFNIKNHSLHRDREPERLSRSLENNLLYFRTVFQECSDVVFREFQMDFQKNHRGALLFIDGLADRKTIEEQVLRPVMALARHAERVQNGITANWLKEFNISIGKIKEETDRVELCTAILSGMAVLLVDNSRVALVLSVPGWEKRAVENSMLEKVVRGPKEGFVETISVNIALIRRRIRDPQLKVRVHELGKRSKTKVAILYMGDIAKEEVVAEVEKRLATVDIDMIHDSSTIEAFIEDNPFSIFPQILPTERPDKVAANLMEGRIALVADGSPSVLVMPVSLASLFQSPEDYYERFIFGTFVRLMRFGVFTIATTLPALYVAMVSFHHQLIPDRLILTLAIGRLLVPFPAFIEALAMEITIELLREASSRLPGPLGQTIGVVGGLVLGQAAVSAQLASPAMVIIVALTAIATFTVPIYSLSYPLRLVRFPMMILAGIFGFFGIFLAWMMLLIHLCALESFGTPYLTPLAPLKPSEWKDTMFRFPFWAMGKRPKSPETVDEIRMRDKKGDGSRG